jgi:membrane protease YdiL (CAAX protease family)
MKEREGTESLVRIMRRHPFLLFFLLTYLIAWTGVLVVIVPKLLGGQEITFLDLGLMAVPMFFTPAIVGVLLTYLFDGGRGLKELSSRMRNWRVGPKWYLPIFMFPVMILLVLAVLNILVSPEFAPYVFLPGIMVGVLAGYFEEVGWTGFAFPRMMRTYGVLPSTLMVGLLQTLWHLAPDLLGTYDSRGVYWLPHFSFFIVSMCAMRVILVWVYLNTGSLLMAQLTHIASTSALSLLVPLSLTPAQDTLFYLAYGVALWFVAGMILLFHYNELPKGTSASERKASVFR